MRTRFLHHGTGFTLAEALLASAILAMTVIAITVPFTVAAQNDQAAGRMSVATFLAQEIMEEILSKPFADPDGASRPGPEPGESTRALFDNTDDYDGYQEDEGQIVHGDGTGETDPQALYLSRWVATTYVTVDGQDAADDVVFIRVCVTVAWRGEPVVRLVRLVYATNESEADLIDLSGGAGSGSGGKGNAYGHYNK